MEKKIKQLIILMILWVSTLTLTAQDRFMVFFTDKNNSEFSVNQPEAFLSQRAIDRRLRNNVTITEADLPVNQEYVDGLKAEGAEVYFTTKWMNGALVQMDASLESAIEGLSFVSGVELVAPGAILSNTQVPVVIPETFLDPNTVEVDTDIQLAMIGADKMHADGYKGEGILIAVFDNGFKGINEYKPFQHIFDEDRLILTRDFVKNSGNVFQYGEHGSSSFSCIAMEYGDKVSGTAPGADFMLCVTEASQEYRVEEYNWLLAAELADSAGADVINSSLGYSTFDLESMDYTYEDMDGETTVVARAAKMLADRGVVVVVSAGNEGPYSWKYITSPADAKDVLAVGSVTMFGEKSSFSSYGPSADGRIKPDVAAMGSSTTIFDIKNENGTITIGGGTSFASPQVAGLAAGILQANPTWTSKELINAIKFSASQALNPDTLIGFGLPNYIDAVQGVVLSAADILNERITVYPNPFSDNTLYIDFGEANITQNLEVSLLDSRGVEIYSDRISHKEVPEEFEINFMTQEKGVYFLILRSRKFEKRVKLIKI